MKKSKQECHPTGCVVVKPIKGPRIAIISALSNYPQPLDRPPAVPLKSSGLLGHQAQPELAPAGTTYMNQSKTMHQHCQH